jgi:DNA-binding GntR family transcriptional regulator
MPVSQISGLVGPALDRASPVPLYFQLSRALEAAIERGDLAPGMLLPNEVEFARALNLSRPTMRQAMQYLVEQGFVVRRRGIGTRVVQPKVRRPLELTSLFEDLSRAKRKPRTDVLSLEVVEPPADVAKALDVEFDSTVYRLGRLRWAGDLQIAVMTNHIPTTLLELTAKDLTRHGLYQLLRRAGVTLRSAHQVIGARRATASEAKLLSESRGAALLTMERTAYNDHGIAVEFGTHIYAASRYTFELSLIAH